MKKRFDRNKLGRSNPENYKWGVLYSNPQDTRLVVRKRNEWLGWTLNFSNPVTYLIIIGILLLVILLGYLEKIL